MSTDTETTNTTTTSSTSNKLSKEDITKYLLNYEKKSINNINLGTHIRYFSALRNKDRSIVRKRDGTPKITFKRGGFLKIKNLKDKYMMLSSSPIQDRSNKKPIVWSVPLDQYTTIFAIKPPIKVNQELRSLRNEVEILKNQLNKIKRKSKSRHSNKS